MTKLEAREALLAEITKTDRKEPRRRSPERHSVTFEWFVRNRYFRYEKETGARRRRKRRWLR